MTERPNFEEEAQRLSALLNTNLLDTPIENRFERVTRLLQNTLNMPITLFNLIDEERQWSKSVQGLRDIELPREKSFCTHTIQGNRIMVVNDARHDDRFSHNPLVTGNPNIVFYAGCPVRAPTGEKIGALCAIDRKPRQLQPKEMQILRDLAGVLETELRLDEMKAQVDGLENKLSAAERNARIDTLTRLPNREGIMDVLQREWASARRSNAPVAVIACDVDNLKDINARHGVEEADEALRQLSRILLSAMRYDDVIARTEGGEFLIVLPGCPEARLGEIMERIHMETLLADIETEKGPVPLTMSFGATALVPDGENEMADLLERADTALGVAKKTGRNKIVLYTPGMSQAA